MGTVVGAPGGHKAGEAGQTPRADAQTAQTAGQTEQTPQRAPGASPETAPKPEQSSTGNQQVGQDVGQVVSTDEQAIEPAAQAPGFGERGRMRRRARFLRKARELAYRDLGGLVFDLHRFGQRNDQLVLAKLATLRQIDDEVRKLEEVLRDRRAVTVLREVGIAACPRCAAIHGSDDRFCPGCGLAFDTNADRPISTASVTPQAQTPAPVQPASATAPVSAPTPASVAQTPAPAPTTISAPPMKSTAQPIAAKPVSPLPASEPKLPERGQEDEPTQILRPPSGGAGA
jgi:hypothetical protein